MNANPDAGVRAPGAGARTPDSGAGAAGPAGRGSLADIPGFTRDAHGKPLIPADAASLYAYGHLVRSTEQLILDLFGQGLLSGTTHTCIGQELSQLAVVRALDNPDDRVLSNHRNHGHFLAYSGDFPGLVAEIMGRAAGVCGGYGGSQHIAFRHFHSNGVQAGMTAIAVGEALALRMRHSEAIVAVMIGDGTLGEGLLYESLNLASVWKLPVLFVVEHNRVAQTTDTSATVAGSIADRGRAFGLQTWQLDDAEPDFAVRAAEIPVQVRESKLPGFLVIETRRLGPHSKGDDQRPDSELLRIAERDPLAALGRTLSSEQRQQIEARNTAFISQVKAEATASPQSQWRNIGSRDRGSGMSGRALSLRPVAAGPATPTGPGGPAGPAGAPAVPMQPVTFSNVRTSINSALRDLLVADERVVLLGEDLHEPYGGAFKVTKGLSSEFPGRVLSTPISEAGITGAGIGLALAGRRPIVEIMFADFVALCFDQLYNHAVKFPGMFPEASVPLIVRTPCGGRRGYGPTHSQSPENILVSIPGLTVVYGSHRHAVGQLLVNAVLRWPNPTVFLEHKLLYTQPQDPGAYEELPADPHDWGAELFPTLRSGELEPDVTLVAFGGILPHVERAAERLRTQEELGVEIVVPSLLAPLPCNALRSALLRRKCILICEEAHCEFGVSAEIMATLAEAGYRGAIARIGTPPAPIAAARSLEREQIPDEPEIVAKVLELI